jgi:hypothetical protein
MQLEISTETGELRRPNGQALPVLRLKSSDMIPTTIIARPEVPPNATVSVWFAPAGSRTGVEGGSGDLGVPFVLTVPGAGSYILTVQVRWGSNRVTSRDLHAIVEQELITAAD